jgi:hypothetical protein
MAPRIGEQNLIDSEVSEASKDYIQLVESRNTPHLRA